MNSDALSILGPDGLPLPPANEPPQPRALYFYRRADLRKTVTKPIGKNESGETVWETVTTDGYGKVIE